MDVYHTFPELAKGLELGITYKFGVSVAIKIFLNSFYPLYFIERKTIKKNTKTHTKEIILSAYEMYEKRPEMETVFDIRLTKIAGTITGEITKSLRVPWYGSHY